MLGGGIAVHVPVVVAVAVVGLWPYGHSLLACTCMHMTMRSAHVVGCIGYTSLSDAMTFKLVPSGGPGPGTEWDYCTSELGVPEQINVQVANPGSVVVSFVTFEVCVCVLCSCGNHSCERLIIFLTKAWCACRVGWLVHANARPKRQQIPPSLPSKVLTSKA